MNIIEAMKCETYTDTWITAGHFYKAEVVDILRAEVKRLTERAEAAERKLAEAREGFPAEAVRHLAEASCHCHTCGPDVDNNRHYQSCMVGRAQAYLGRRVTEKPVFGPRAALGEVERLEKGAEAAECQLREARLAVRERDIWKLAAQEKGIADLHSAERILHNTLMYAEGYRSAELAYDPLYAALSMLVRIIEGIECWHEASDELVKAVDTARKLLGRR